MKKIFLIFLIFALMGFGQRASALNFSLTETKTTINPTDSKLELEESNEIYLIKPSNDSQDEQAGVLATSTFIGDEEYRQDELSVSDFNESSTNDVEIDKKEKEDSGGEKNEMEREKEDDFNENVSLDLLEEKTELPGDKKQILEIAPENNSTVKIEEDNKKPNLVIDVANFDVGALLDVCNIGPSCSGDVGKTHWMKEASVRPDGMNLGLRYSTDNNEIKEGVLEVSYYSFINNENPVIVYTKGINTGESIFDFSVLVESNYEIDMPGNNISGVTSKTGEREVFKQKKGFAKFFEIIKNILLKPINWIKNIFKKSDLEIKPVTISNNLKIKHNEYYLRVIPVKEGKVFGRASNEIKVVLAPPQEDVEIFTPAKIYEVKIKEFKPIRAASPDICTGAIILDTDWLRPKIGGGIESLKVGDRVCPKPYKGEGEEAWYESLWDAIKSGVNWVSEAYNNLKSAVVNTVASAICSGDETCKMAISTGLDVGLVAMGAPPTLPNFDELVDSGFDYLASEIAVQTGCSDVACKDLIKDKLKKALDSQKDTNPTCKGEEEAHNMGIEPLCLPDNIKAHRDPLATHRNANAILEIKRNYNEGPIRNFMNAPFKLYFTNAVYNDGLIGNWIRNIPPYGRDVKITEPLYGQAFQSTTITIPDLEKGEVIEIPIVFTPVEYWIPGHKEAMEGWTTETYGDGWVVRQYDDWWKLYYGGTLTMQAVIDGCDFYDPNINTCIISKDSMTVQLPNTINP